MSAAPRIPTTRYRAAKPETTVCPGCRTELPVHATFCVECGLCMLDVTSEGTVIVRPPEAEEAPVPPPPKFGKGVPVKVVDDSTSEAIELQEEDLELELDIDALVAGLLETPEPTSEEKMTSRFKRVPPTSVKRDVSATLSSDLSSTVADEIEVEVDLTESDIETFFEEVSSPIRLARGPLTPLSHWPAPAPGNTVVGPAPTH